MASFQLCFLTLIFPPQRGEHHPLMWGFIPHVLGRILYDKKSNDTFLWNVPKKK